MKTCYLATDWVDVDDVVVVVVTTATEEEEDLFALVVVDDATVEEHDEQEVKVEEEHGSLSKCRLKLSLRPVIQNFNMISSCSPAFRICSL